MSDEPNIVINGQTLTAAQAMAVRVAITSFHAEMAEADALGSDEHGRRMAAAYRDRLSEVLGLMPWSDDRAKLTPALADFVHRCQAYLDDAPANGGHSDAAGSNAYELIEEAIEAVSRGLMQ